MTTIHDDLPHPVPPIAYLRWKENWFFIVMDPERGIHGVIHCNTEPAYDRARYSCHLSVQGQSFKYVSETPFPEHFAMAREIGDGRFQVKFVEPHGRIDLALRSEELEFDLSFTKSLP